MPVTRRLALLVVLFLAALLQPHTARAQAPWAAQDGPPLLSPVPFPPGADANAAAATTPDATWDDTALPPLPSPLSYRYVRHLGESGVPYFPADRLNEPFGLTTVGEDVWVTEQRTSRALRLSSTGALVQQIGTLGDVDISGRSLRTLSDIAVDAGGNLWLADEDASHVVQFNAAGEVVKSIGHTWSCGAQNDNFCHPVGLAFDAAGNLYVSDGTPWWTRDRGNQRIQVFKPNGDYLTTIGTTGVASTAPLQFDGPRRIAVYGNELFVVEAGNSRVQIINIGNPLAPQFVGQLGVTGELGGDNAHFGNPSGIAVDAQFIYVADTWNNRVQIYSRTTRAYVATLAGTWGSGANQLKGPQDVAVTSQGMIYVSDRDNFRVQVFNSQRQHVRTLGVTGEPYLTDARHFLAPYAVAVAADGSIFVSEEHGHRLLKLDANGALVWSVGRAGVNGGWDFQIDRLNTPTGIALAPNGHVYVADRYNSRVLGFNANGLHVATLGEAGQSGTGNGHFNAPNSLGFGPDGKLYVADTDNHRVQVFDANLNYLATMGVTGQAGTDNGHFSYPYAVVVDSAGMIYVADNGNHRIQVFNSQRQVVRTLGTTGSSGREFGRFNNPSALAVDTLRRLYVVDTWNNRVQVFDRDGNFLSVIGGQNTRLPGGFWGPRGIAVSATGQVYVANPWNTHRVDVFAPGTPDWAQRNVNGFGDPQTRYVAALEVFNGALYAGTTDYSLTGARRIMRLEDGAQGPQWTEVVGAAFGRGNNVFVRELTAWNGHLYAGTQHWFPSTGNSEGGEIWRSSDGATWTPVMEGGFGDANNIEVFGLTPFSDTLLASTWNYTTGTQIWQSSDGLDWTQVVDDGLDRPSNTSVLVMAPFNGYLYAGLNNRNNATNRPDGCEIWRTPDGTTWHAVVTGGLGGANCYGAQSMAAFGDHLYVGTGIYDFDNGYYPGGEIWRCAAASGCDVKSDWEMASTPGFGKRANAAIPALAVVEGYLYAATHNQETGMEVWRSGNGTTWEEVGGAGFGDVFNYSLNWQKAFLPWENTLWVGTYNGASGGELWQYQPERTVLRIDTPDQPGQLVHAKSDGGTVTVQVPANTVSETATLVYRADGGLAAPADAVKVGSGFRLELVVGDAIRSGVVFTTPLTVIIDYTAAQVRVADEDALTLWVWNPTTQAFEDAACGAVTRQPGQNRISVPVCHLSRFVLAGPATVIYLPTHQR